MSGNAVPIFQGVMGMSNLSEVLPHILICLFIPLQAGRPMNGPVMLSGENSFKK